MNIPTQSASRFIIGVDLGTTTIEVFYVDTLAGTDIHLFAIPQLVAAGEVMEHEVLPSFCYLSADQDLPDGALHVPWTKDHKFALGLFAQERGASVPGRLVSSAKSWLAHTGVDREAAILPWGGALGEEAISPVLASRRYLEHIRDAWNHRFGNEVDEQGTPCLLAEQQVILTVPASFDEVARELTVQAAREAGFERLVLLEEPLAAFYSWLVRHEEDWQARLREGDRVLVVDIGGGTTDFSLIEVEQGYHVRRTAVGDHLLLGGDNIDMALAREIERTWKKKLPPREWGLLCQQCRQAKEKLFSQNDLEKVPVHLTGSGSSVIGGSRKAEITRARLIELLEDGFFPEVEVDGPDPSRRSGIQEMGLPYAADPAITKHLLAFLRLANPEHQAKARGRERVAPVLPTQVLFNGGALIPVSLRKRICRMLGHWAGSQDELPELVSPDLRGSVAHGAAYYGLVRRGQGQRVRGGIARSYYIEVQGAERPELLCIMPRDKDEGEVVELTDHTFHLAANQAVRFPLFCSSTRLGDKPGALLADREEISELPVLQSLLQYGKASKRTKLDVRVAAMLNEVGTLELWCETADRQNRYPLSFDLRAAGASSSSTKKGIETEVLVSAEVLREAGQLLRDAFESEVALVSVVRDLESVIRIQRSDWGATLLRHLGDILLEIREVRLRSPEHEKRWLNLAGMCLRPGYGAPGDEFRAREIWKIWHNGCCFGNRAAVAAEWWTAWRRVAGGLRAGHHDQIFHAIRKKFQDPDSRMPAPKQREPQESAEMWRCLGALERVGPEIKLKLLEPLVQGLTWLKDYHYWAIARFGARRMLYGPANSVIPAEKLAPLLKPFFKQAASSDCKTVPLAITSLCQRTGLRNLDVPAAERKEAMALLERYPNAEEHCKPIRSVCDDMSMETQSELSGDRLPLGLALARTEE